MSTALWSFALVVGLLVVTPGLDTTVIMRTAAVGDAPAPGEWCWGSRRARSSGAR
ncbi:hypothetical protein ABZ519_19810 [Streptomyces collinus]|uniref:hypothetical protein n=1 Tax=Streptomyces collinus TaxID=42684 RepID=UPI0033EA4FB1